MKRLTKAFYCGSAMWRKWKIIDRIAKKVYEEEYAGSCSVGSVRKRWIDTVKDLI